MREIADIAAAWRWQQEQPGSIAWLLAALLRTFGSDMPWTTRAVLGRPESPNG